MCVKSGPDDAKVESFKFPGGEWREAISLKRAKFPVNRNIITVRVLVRTPDGKAADETTPVEWRRFHKKKLTGSGTFVGRTDAIIHADETGLRIDVRPSKTVRLVYEPIAHVDPPAPAKKTTRKKAGS